MPDKKFEPNEYASPVCYAHELMPAFKDEVAEEKQPTKPQSKNAETVMQKEQKEKR
jgi:hypothetical protein